MHISIIQAILLGSLYYLTNNGTPLLTGLGSVSIRQPIVCGTITGLILGDVVQGLIIGATILLNALGVEWLYKALEQYTYIIIPMQIIMPTLTLIGISNVTGIQMMVPLGREKQVLYSEIAGAIVDLVLNTIFIPIYGAAGAALGTLVAEAVVLGWQCVAIRDLKMGIFQKLPYGKILIAVGLGSAASFWVKLLGVGVFPTLVISAVCFFGVYGIVMTVLKDSLILELGRQLAGKLRRK